jgi:hypothetical protein
MQVDTYVEISALNTELIDLGIQLMDIHILDIDIVHGEEQNRQRRVQQIEQLDGSLGVVLLSTEPTVEVEPELTHRLQDVLVEHVADEVAHTDVVVSSMREQQDRQVSELCDGVVGRIDCLHTLLAADANADVGFLDHRHVVGAVSNGERADRHAVLVHGHTLLDELHHFSLLVRRHTTGHHGLTALRELQQHVLAGLVVAIVHSQQTGPIDNESTRFGARRVAHIRAVMVAVVAATAVCRTEFTAPIAIRGLLQLLRLDHTELLLQSREQRLRIGACLLVDDDVLHELLRLHQVARHGDVDGGLFFVAREHPYVKAGPHELGDALGHAVLQLVLNRGGTQQICAKKPIKCDSQTY